MTVPSYDDLTPGIPDVIDSDAAGNLASLLRERPVSSSQLPAARFPLPASSALLSALYACVRLTAGSRQPEADSRQLDALLGVARDFSPRVRRAPAREVVLDASGLGRLIGPPREIARQLAHALADAGAAASVGIGPTQTIARVLARATGHGHTCQHNDHEDHKEDAHSFCDLCDLRGRCAGACARGPWLQLPVDWLQEFEVLPPAMNQRDRIRVYDTLERWGITTFGELAALPAAALSSRLGRRGLALQRLARGVDATPFVPDDETPRYLGRLELEWPIDALEPLSFVFARLLEPLAAQLERADRGATAVRLDLRLTDRSTHGRVLQLPAPMRDPRVLRTLLLLDLESTPLFAGDVMIDVVTIELDPAPARITQFSLLQRALPSPETLSTLTARLSALVGESRVGSPALVDSHAPDAFVVHRYAPEGPPSPRRGFGATAVPVDERKAVLRRQRPPLAIRVSVEHGRPVHIAASCRGVPSGAITQAAGPWRTSGGWWVTSGAGGSGQGKGAGWNRDEWDVALKRGAVCRIYCDRTIDRWFLDGIYD